MSAENLIQRAGVLHAQSLCMGDLVVQLYGSRNDGGCVGILGHLKGQLGVLQKQVYGEGRCIKGVVYDTLSHLPEQAADGGCEELATVS